MAIEVDEMQVVRRAGSGEMQAATELVDKYYRAVYAFLRRLTANEADAADLTQKTFSRLWSALPRFAGRSSVNSWIHGIAYHVFQDYLRANRRTQTQPDDWWLECPDTKAGPDQLALDADLRSTLFGAVNQLQPELRDTVHLHYYQGLTLEETAASLEIAQSTVKYRLRSAVQQLQSALADKPPLPSLTKKL